MAGEQPDKAERTEPATPKRIEDARQRGQVAQSREVQTVALLWSAVLLGGSSLGVHLVTELAGLAGDTWSRAGSGLGGNTDFHVSLFYAIARAGSALFPLLLVLVVAGGGAAFVQIGPLFSFEALAPKASRLSPISGFKRMASPDRLFDLGKALFKLAVVGTITYSVISSSAEFIPAVLQVPIGEGLRFAGRLGGKVAFASLGFLTAMAVIDLLYVRSRHAKQLRMSRKEVRDEIKDREGSPQMRSRTRAMQQELSRSRMIESVADASVVVTNPTHYAVALQYGRDLSAPRVLAKGRNHVAMRIREIARKNDVPIIENPPLARLLHKTAKVGEDIPEALFQAVAEVLAFIYRVDSRRAREWGASA